ncbi:MAG TPA: carboxypeptidase regulatory-like domain-containing protein [Terriglobales bacterium]|nr:carboxypeptidase regulatory-like domain-containing protein [Terriglobales bacterium]
MRILCNIVLALLSWSAFAQAPTATLSGKVTDQTGAVIPQATVTLSTGSGTRAIATTDQLGGYQIQSLPAGSYNVSATAKGFANFSRSNVALGPGQSQTLDVTLQVKAQEEKVNVNGEEGQPQLDVSSDSNAGALIIKGKDLEALSDDPDELQSELQALAGPSAGPNGGQIYIDGFTGGQLPPKSAIREIRINQNPFSAQYDKLGYGRIEIFTKPGSDKFHGQFFFNDSNSVLNSRNPYVPVKPDYNSEIFDGNFGGPINKKASFFIDASRRNMNDFSAIAAIDPAQLPYPLPAGFQPALLNQSIANPRTRTSISPRIDFQLTPTNTLTARYQLTHESEQNGGLGSFSLPSVGYDLNETEHTLQISDTQILGPNVVNESRFQFQRETNHQLPIGTGPFINVQSSFTTGESTEGLVRTTQDNYEFQNYTSVTRGRHLIKFGARLRGITSSESTDANFNGTFVFSSPDGTRLAALQAYQNASHGLCQSGANYNPLNCPSQFSISTGAPRVSVGWFDAGLYAEDEWRLKPNLSVTYGLRFESQNNIHDHADFAPRIGIAWGLGSNGKSAPKTVLRGGFGIFYDRFGYNLVEQADLLDGVTQQKAVVAAPQFFSADGSGIPSFSQLAAIGSPTVYQISPNLRAPYTIQSAASIERQITKTATFSVTYLNSRGEHAFYIDNVNAPAPWLNGARPQATLYNNDNIYQYGSGGIFRQNQLIANIRVSTGKRLSLFGFYTLNYANSNASSGGSAGGFFSSGGTSSASFLSNQFDPLADYGRAAFDVRHRAFIGGNITLPYAFSLSPFIIINSGQPYNLTTGQDNNGDSIFNDRPSFVSANENAVCTTRADFATSVTAFGEAPVNYCTGPSNTTFNLRMSKTIGFGPETKGGPAGGALGGHHGHGGGLGPGGLSGNGGNVFFRGPGGAVNHLYNLTFSISVRNLFNTFNPGNPIGNLSSPRFGEAISVGGGPFASASANRRVDLQVRFSF